MESKFRCAFFVVLDAIPNAREMEDELYEATETIEDACIIADRFEDIKKERREKLQMNNIQEEKKLNTRQWDIYNYLIKCDGKPTNLYNIYNAVKNHFNNYEINNNNWLLSSVRRTITKDIQVLNNSSVIQKVIMSDTKGIYILSENNVEEMLKKEKMKLLKMLKRFWLKEEKTKLNHQKRVVFNSERNIIESLLEGEN